MTKRKLMMGSVLATALAALVVGGPVSAREGGHDGQMHRTDARGPGMGMEGRGMQGMLRGLDLTDEQRAKVEEIQRSQETVMREKMKALHASKAEFQAATFTKTFDVKKVRALADAQAKTMADLAVARAETLNKIYNLLTPDQQKQLAERKDERHGRFER